MLVPHRCSPAGGLLAVVDAYPPFSAAAVAFSPDFGLSWTTPHLTDVYSLTSGPGCAFYVTRSATADAFVAKLGPDGRTLWATFLGGSDRDAPVALALDAPGNVYVTGNTSSPDFPITVPHIGSTGENSVFIAEFSSAGKLIYSATVGGEYTSSAAALAVDASQNAYIVGTTSSVDFPVTSGVIGSRPGGGFLAKLSSSGALIYASYLPQPATALLVDANGEPIVASSGQAPGEPAGPAGDNSEFVLKLDSTASQVLSYDYLPTKLAGSEGVTGLATDAQNNLLVFGQTLTGSFQATPGAYSSPRPVASCLADITPLPDAFLLKLRASDWQPVYGALFTAPCGLETGAVVIDSNGSAILAMEGGSGLPLRSPLLAGPACSIYSGAVAKLSADGNTLQYGTYLPYCGAPVIASFEGLLYAGVGPNQGDATSVLRLSDLNAGPVSIDQISNAFSGDASVVVGLGLYTIATSGFQPVAINLGINPGETLPDQLSGVQVKFDGVPAAILAVAPGQVIVAVPDLLGSPDEPRGIVGQSSSKANLFTSVQLFYNGVLSNSLWMPVSNSLPGLLTVDFPNLMNDADGNVRNQDGTPNNGGESRRGWFNDYGVRDGPGCYESSVGSRISGSCGRGIAGDSGVLVLGDG